MNHLSASASVPIRHLTVYPADAFRVTHGVNEGDGLTDADELVHEDIYELTFGAAPRRLAVHMTDGAQLTLAGDTEAGHAGAPVFLDSLVTFMTPDGNTLEALILVEVDAASGTIEEVHLHPFAPLDPATPIPSSPSTAIPRPRAAVWPKPQASPSRAARTLPWPMGAKCLSKT